MEKEKIRQKLLNLDVETAKLQLQLKHVEKKGSFCQTNCCFSSKV